MRMRARQRKLHESAMKYETICTVLFEKVETLKQEYEIDCYIMNEIEHQNPWSLAKNELVIRRIVDLKE